MTKMWPCLKASFTPAGSTICLKNLVTGYLLVSDIWAYGVESIAMSSAAPARRSEHCKSNLVRWLAQTGQQQRVRSEIFQLYYGALGQHVGWTRCWEVRPELSRSKVNQMVGCWNE